MLIESIVSVDYVNSIALCVRTKWPFARLPMLILYLPSVTCLLDQDEHLNTDRNLSPAHKAQSGESTERELSIQICTGHS